MRGDEDKLQAADKESGCQQKIVTASYGDTQRFARRQLARHLGGLRLLVSAHAERHRRHRRHQEGQDDKCLLPSICADHHLRDRQQGELSEGAETRHQPEGDGPAAGRHHPPDGADGNRDAGAAETKPDQRLTEEYAARRDDIGCGEQACGIDRRAKDRHLPRPDPVGHRAEQRR